MYAIRSYYGKNQIFLPQVMLSAETMHAAFARLKEEMKGKPAESLGRITSYNVCYTKLLRMHMSDALLSPAVGGTLWAAAAATIGYCSRQVRRRMDDYLVPLMGVLGAFVFAAQMINFTIPGTGSSGHLGGGLLLAVLLGPHAAFLVIASVLTVQALFFADGGLLALGSNIINLGFFPCSYNFV